MNKPDGEAVAQILRASLERNVDQRLTLELATGIMTMCNAQLAGLLDQPAKQPEPKAQKHG